MARRDIRHLVCKSVHPARSASHIATRGSRLLRQANRGSRMSLDFILVAGPLVRASSWEPTARHLREAGYRTQVPDVLAHHQPPPSWSAWNAHLLELINAGSESVLVGHSSASALVADLTGKAPCRCLIVVDGEVPPSQGAASPVRPELRDFIESLAGPDGTLPIWSRWSGDARRTSLVGLDILASDPIAFAEFESGLPRLSVDWFDDTIELADWEHVPAGFIQTSAIYDHAAAEAQRRGWPVERLQGTHLHPPLRPAETAGPPPSPWHGSSFRALDRKSSGSYISCRWNATAHPCLRCPHGSRPLEPEKRFFPRPSFPGMRCAQSLLEKPKRTRP